MIRNNDDFPPPVFLICSWLDPWMWNSCYRGPTVLHYYVGPIQVVPVCPFRKMNQLRIALHLFVMSESSLLVWNKSCISITFMILTLSQMTDQLFCRMSLHLLVSCLLTVRLGFFGRRISGMMLHSSGGAYFQFVVTYDVHFDHLIQISPALVLHCRFFLFFCKYFTGKYSETMKILCSLNF
jgi:hypothetical protein